MTLRGQGPAHETEKIVRNRIIVYITYCALHGATREGNIVMKVKTAFGVLVPTIVVLSITMLAHASRPYTELPRNIQPFVALTFDDGPSSEYTPSILDTLKKYGIHATFFVIGKNAEKNPGLVKREADEENVVANHTYTHPLFTQLETPKQLSREILKTQSIIEKITGATPHLFRPPHGWPSPWLVAECRKLGYHVVTWTIDPRDWEHPTSRMIVKRVFQKRDEGGIVLLLHDGLELRDHPRQGNTVQALSEIIRRYRDKGYRFVTIDDILRDSSVAEESKVLAGTISKPLEVYR